MTTVFLHNTRKFDDCGNLHCWKKCFVALLIILICIVLCIQHIDNLEILASTPFVIREKNLSTSANVSLATNMSLTSSNPVLAKKHVTLDDIHISVKSTKKFHEKRLNILLDTWIQTSLNQTYIFTDEDDKKLANRLPEGHVVNTKCRRSHSIRDLCCKFAMEYNYYIRSGKSWFCHVDDDNYLNVDLLLQMLRGYDPLELWYLGRASRDHPVTPPRKNLRHVKFWFATLGAGVCISKALAKKMLPHASDGKFSHACDHTGMPDDCTLGYIINHLLGVNLTIVNNFHSHMEILKDIKDPENQITLGFSGNVITIEGFDVKEDPTRLKSLHCKLHPKVDYCSALKQNITN